MSFAQRLRAALTARRWMIVSVGGVALLHLATLFPGVGGRVNHGDSAKFQFIGLVSGIGHPPGNPLYLLVNAAWLRAMPCPPWLAGTLLSWTCAVGTLVYLFAGVRKLLGEREAVASVLALGLGSLFWTFATEAEVYTLNTFLLAAAQYHAIGFALEGRRRELLLGSAFFLFGFANHLTCVFLIPAFLAVAWAGRRDVRVWTVLAIAGITLLAASVYGYIALRVLGDAPYSEYREPLSWRSFGAFVTAAAFRQNVAKPGVAELVTTRLPAVLEMLERQWVWPLMLLAPLGWARARARSRAIGSYLLLGVAGPLAFALVYDIPDADGFYMPIVLLVATMIGAAFGPRTRTTPFAWLLPLVAALVVVASASLHVENWKATPPSDAVENIDGLPGNVLWDLPDLVRRVPVGARIAVPCPHYGCVEVLEYYRFADPTFRARRLSFVRLATTPVGYWDVRGVPLATSGDAIVRQACVCTLNPNDAARWRSRDAVRTLPRTGRYLAGRWYEGVPVYCSSRCAIP